MKTLQRIHDPHIIHVGRPLDASIFVHLPYLPPAIKSGFHSEHRNFYNARGLFTLPSIRSTVYMLKIYDFAKADIKTKQRLFTQNQELRSVYIFLLRHSEHFDNIVALYKKSPAGMEMLEHLRSHNLSLLVDSLTETQDQENVINYAYERLGKDDYAMFVEWIRDDDLRKLALDKAEEKKVIRPSVFCVTGAKATNS